MLVRKCFSFSEYLLTYLALLAINNANDFRQQHNHSCVNKIQKNCSISRLRIAYLPRTAKTLLFFNNVRTLAWHRVSPKTAEL